jgi:hypothetical protein
MLKKLRNYLSSASNKNEKFKSIKLDLDFWAKEIFFNNDLKMIYEFENNQEKHSYSVKSNEVLFFEDKKLLLAKLYHYKNFKKILKRKQIIEFSSYILFFLFPFSYLNNFYFFSQFILLLSNMFYRYEYYMIDLNYFIKSFHLLDNGQTCEIELFNQEILVVDINLIRKPKQDHIDLIEKSPTTQILRAIPVIINGKAYYIDYKIHIFHKEILSAVLNGNYISINENKKIDMEEVIQVKL